jgi:acyl transferase domain-containing protein
MTNHSASARKLRLEEDGNDIAICGFSLKFPGDAVSSELFWKMMAEKRCATTPFPKNRFNGEGFYRKKGGLNTVGAFQITQVTSRLKRS